MIKSNENTEKPMSLVKFG